MDNLSKAQSSKLASFETKSAKIRYLLAAGYTRSQVSKKLGIIYQHVRNVELMQVKNFKESIK